MNNSEDRLISLYRKVNSRAGEWGQHVPAIANAGFQILFGPPIVGGPLIVSLNPGNAHVTDDLWPERWPDKLSYLRNLAERRPFAEKLKRLFESTEIDLEKVNASCVLMFRSHSMKEWNQTVPRDVRHQAEYLSLDVLTQVIETLQPKFIYAAGFSTFERMGISVVHSEIGRRKRGGHFELLRFGEFENTPVVASPHPSGYRLNSDNMKQISRAISRAT